MCGHSSDKLPSPPSSNLHINIASQEKRGLADGVYVPGSVNGVPVTFTADTGASRTIISKRLYESLPMEKRPSLNNSSRLIGAGGAPITGAGKAKFEISLGPLDLLPEVLVAEIEDDALLGYDILRGSEGRPADILLSSNRIILEGMSIPVIQVGQEKTTRRVVMADDVEIPGGSEAVISVFVERFEADDEADLDYIVEPTDQFREKYPLQLAATLVNINEGPACKVRVMNPFTEEVELKQNAVIGKAERVERIISVISKSESEVESRASVRRIQLDHGKKPVVRNKQDQPAAKIPQHLESLYERSTQGKSEWEKRAVGNLLSRYEHAFSRSDWDVGLTSLAEHSIDTGDAAPIKQRPRRVPLAYAEEEKKAIEDLLQKGVIRKSTSPWASPIVLVRKKNGTVRPCVDYRKVNSLVKPDGFPLPRVQDCLDAVAGAKYFSSFDLTSGYFQIPLKEADIPKSAFCCKYGHFEMLRLPFGLNNAASTFQRTMELALQGLQWETCLIYIDDIIVYGADFNQHMQRVEQVLQRISDAGLKLRPDKCHMLQTEVVFLGHVVSQEGVLPDPTNVSKIVNWPTPTNCKQVKQFVATGSYYRRFVKNFATVARPLTELTKKDAKFHWSISCQEAFEKLKSVLTGPDIMGYPMNDAGTFYLDTDASGVGIGGVLSQIQSGRERVISYASRSTNKAERNYCITEQELLAVVYMIQYFRQYLLGRRFIVRTDHQALVWLFGMKEPSGKIARWIEILATYDFAVEYRPGKKMGHVDALSRCETPSDCRCSEVDMSEPLKCGPCPKCRRRAEIMVASTSQPGDVQMQPNQEGGTVEPAIPVRETSNATTNPTQQSSSRSSTESTSKAWLWVGTTEEISKKQMNDANIAPILAAKISGTRPESTDMEMASPATRHYWILWDSLTVKDGVLCRLFNRKNGTDEHVQLIAPKEMQHDILRQMHNNVLSGHLGVRKTKEKLSKCYYWFNLRQDVNLHVRRCDTCAADKLPSKTPRASMGHLSSGAPWDTLALDYLGPLPETDRGNKYILVITDHFTKYVEVIPVPNQLAEDCASRLVNEVIARWGTPLRIHSDQGATFESRVFKELCRLLEVKKTRTSARNPRGNGQVERFNRTLLKMVKSYLCGEQKDWDLYLGCLAGAYRASPNESTRLSPNILNLGREVRLPADIVYGHTSVTEEEVPAYCDYVEELRYRLLRAHDVARKHLKQSAKRSKEVYDTRVAQINFEKGDLVWCLLEARKVGVCPKLQKRFDGPFVVQEKLSPINFRIQTHEDGSCKVVHHNKLKRYEGITPPKWVVKVAKRLGREAEKM